MNKDIGYNPEKDEKGFNSYYDEFHFLIGKVVVNINLIESKIIFLICNLLNTDDITTGFIECKRKNATQLLKLLKELIKTKINSNEIINEFNELYLELRKVIEHRNVYMHSVYYDSSNFKIKLNRNLKEIRKISLREFEKGSKSIETQIIYDLTSLRALVQWLSYLYDEIEEFTFSISKVIKIKHINFDIPIDEN